jgi:hypothetical protein
MFKTFFKSSEKKWGVRNISIGLISFFALLFRYGLFVYPKFHPPWNYDTGPSLLQNFMVWGSAGGAKVSFLRFKKL